MNVIYSKWQWSKLTWVFSKKCFYKIIDNVIFTNSFNFFPTLPNQKKLDQINDSILVSFS